MKAKISIQFILLIFLVSCGSNKEEAQKYLALAAETAELISKCDSVMKYQEIKLDSIGKILDSLDKIKEKYLSLGQLEDVKKLLDGDVRRQFNEESSISDISNRFLVLKGNLKIVYVGYIKLEGFNKALLHIKRKSDMNVYKKLISDSNKEIKRITGVYTTEVYINRYLPINQY
jgi:hypothetical protein